jgi:lysophospholipase L1-like esterase
VSDATGTARVGSGSRLGACALACCAAWLAFALTAQRIFPHLEGLAGTTGTVDATRAAAGGTHDALFQALLVGGIVLGLLALRRPGRGNILCASVALVLLAPFAADLALFPMATAPLSHAAKTTVFVALTELIIAGVLLACGRALAREARRAARTPLEADATVAPPELATAGAPSARAPRRSVLLRAGLVAGSIAATLALGELAFRALDLRPYTNPVLIIPGAERRILLSEIALFRPSERPPGTDGLASRWRPYLYLKGWYDRPLLPYFDAQGCVDYVFNRWGLRDHDFALEKQPGEYRIVAIGDSFTFGVGAQLDDCWTEVLERTLKAQRGGPVEVINAGFASGHHPGMYEPWIAKDGVRLQPDVLIVGFCLNDMHPGVEMYTYELPDPPPVLGGHSVLASYLALQLQVWKHPGKRVRDFTDRVLNEPAQWESVQAALRRSKAVLDEHGIRFLVVPFPMLSGLQEKDYPYARLMQMVRDFCASAHIECVDLLPDFLGKQDETLWAHPTDQHPNDKGHALIAAGIARYLAQH